MKREAGHMSHKQTSPASSDAGQHIFLPFYISFDPRTDTVYRWATVSENAKYLRQVPSQVRRACWTIQQTYTAHTNS